MKKICFLLPLLFCACAGDYTAVTLPNGALIKAELALTPEQQARGLMRRYELAENKGMLFPGAMEEEKTFWMKNTFISLDIIFISQDKKINCIYESVKPSTFFTRDEDVARVTCPAQYVLELAAGVSQKQNLKPGDKLKFNVK